MKTIFQKAKQPFHVKNKTGRPARFLKKGRAGVRPRKSTAPIMSPVRERFLKFWAGRIGYLHGIWLVLVATAENAALLNFPPFGER